MKKKPVENSLRISFFRKKRDKNREKTRIPFPHIDSEVIYDPRLSQRIWAISEISGGNFEFSGGKFPFPREKRKKLLRISKNFSEIRIPLDPKNFRPKKEAKKFRPKKNAKSVALAEFRAKNREKKREIES